jgi:UDP-glucuronate 4-epimerase
MRILVTGCTGFVGSNLTELLLRNNHLVYCVARHGHDVNSKKLTHMDIDLTQPIDNMAPIQDLDCIIHCAAVMNNGMKPYHVFLANTIATLNVLEYGKLVKVNNFIYISSGAVYGYRKLPISERCTSKPNSIYGLSKYESELLVKYYNKHFSTIILRLSFPYGPEQINGIIPKLIAKLINDEPIAIYDGESPYIVPTHIDDICNVILLSLQLKRNTIMNVCGDEGVSIKALSQIIGKYLDKKPLFRHLHDKSIKNLLMSNYKMKRTLRYTPRQYLDDGIRKYITSTKLNVK